MKKILFCVLTSLVSVIYAQEQTLTVKFPDANNFTVKGEFAYKDQFVSKYFKFVPSENSNEPLLLIYIIGKNNDNLKIMSVSLENYRENKDFTVRQNETKTYVSLPCKTQDCISMLAISSAVQIEGSKLPFNVLEFESKEKAEAFVKKAKELLNYEKFEFNFND